MSRYQIRESINLWKYAEKLHGRAVCFKVFVLLFITFVAPNACVDSVFSLCFVVQYLMSFLVLQSEIH